VKYGYPGQPDLEADFEKALEQGYEAACKEAESSALTWTQLLKHTGAPLADWLQQWHRELFYTLEQLPDSVDQVLVVGHGPTALALFGPSLMDTWTADECSGAVIELGPRLETLGFLQLTP